MGTFFDQPCSS